MLKLILSDPDLDVIVVYIFRMYESNQQVPPRAFSNTWKSETVVEDVEREFIDLERNFQATVLGDS
jgi:hypothetical protein